MLEKLIALFAFLFGMAVGSFVNVCIYRLPRRLSIFHPRSHCPNCGMTLRWVDLVPLLSYLWLLGKCRYCKTPISPRYFVVELMTALLFVAAVKCYHLSLGAVLIATSLAALLVIAFVDWEFFLVPDEAVWALGIFGVLRQIVTEASPRAVGFSLLGALVAGGIVWLIGVIGRWLFRREAMGFGDVKIAAAIGTHLGLAWTALLSFILLSVFIGAAVGGSLAIIQRRSLTGYMPFGPAMAAAAGLMLLYPSQTVTFIAWLHGIITEFVLRLFGIVS